MTIQKNGLFWYALIGIFLIFFSGCASLDKADCRQGDWFGIGYEDGVRGCPASQIGNHRKACSKYGVKPDYQEYESGRIKGLEKYCTAQNGYRLGKKGYRYNAVCPDHMKDPFLEAYHLGKTVHQIKKDIKATQRKINHLKTDIQKNKEKISGKEKELVKDGIKSSKRKIILEDIRSLEEDIKENRSQIRHFRQMVEENEFDLDRIESHIEFD
ncbi:MAG TPA: DUF2799 domain-containing protein [Desulfobacterales bacterium]|nr:DUF2799 domain-containing protein [Desulfobacterales bacterium]